VAPFLEGAIDASERRDAGRESTGGSRAPGRLANSGPGRVCQDVTEKIFQKTEIVFLARALGISSFGKSILNTNSYNRGTAVSNGMGIAC
jgi:hypothetical protein